MKAAIHDRLIPSSGNVSNDRQAIYSLLTGSCSVRAFGLTRKRWGRMAASSSMCGSFRASAPAPVWKPMTASVPHCRAKGYDVCMPRTYNTGSIVLRFRNLTNPA